MKCQNCGSIIPDDSGFCQFCGEPISKEDTLICPACKMSLPEDSDFCQFCGHKIGKKVTINNSGKKERKPKPLFGILVASVIAIGLIGVIIWQHLQVSEIQKNLDLAQQSISDMTATCDKLHATRADLESKLKALQANLDFYQEYVVFVDDDTRYYHCDPRCSKFDSSNFWAYNIDLAKSKGYSACSICANPFMNKSALADLLAKYGS